MSRPSATRTSTPLTTITSTPDDVVPGCLDRGPGGASGHPSYLGSRVPIPPPPCRPRRQAPPVGPSSSTIVSGSPGGSIGGRSVSGATSSTNSPGDEAGSGNGGTPEGGGAGVNGLSAVRGRDGPADRGMGAGLGSMTRPA